MISVLLITEQFYFPAHRVKMNESRHPNNHCCVVNKDKQKLIDKDFAYYEINIKQVNCLFHAVVFFSVTNREQLQSSLSY